MFLILLMVVGTVIAKKNELGEEPDYYPKVNPNPNNIEDFTINDIPVYFDMFNRFYEIDYKNDEHLNRSFEIFTDNVKRIIIMNKFSTAAKFAINEFTHISLEEFTEKYTGFNETELEESSVNVFSYNSTQGAPKNLDWRALGLPPLVRHQGPCKSSYVFSAVANIEAQAAKNFKRTLRLSEQQAYDCEPTGTCKYGGLPHKVMESVMNIGGLEEQINYIYDPKDQRECKIQPKHMVVKVKSVQRVKPLYENGLIALLALYGPIVTTMYVSESVKNYHKGVLWPTDCDKKPNHAVLLVGYGVTADSIPFWIIKNSWGVMWGEAGYIRLIRGESACNIGQYVATATVEIIDRSNISFITEELSPFQQNVSVAINGIIRVPKTTKKPTLTPQALTSTTTNIKNYSESDDLDKKVNKNLQSETSPTTGDLARKENNKDKILVQELPPPEAEVSAAMESDLANNREEEEDDEEDDSFESQKQKIQRAGSSSSETQEEASDESELKKKKHKIDTNVLRKGKEKTKKHKTEEKVEPDSDSGSELHEGDDSDDYHVRVTKGMS